MRQLWCLKQIGKAILEHSKCEIIAAIRVNTIVPAKGKVMWNKKIYKWKVPLTLLGYNLILCPTYKQQRSIVFNSQFNIIQIAMLAYGNANDAAQAGGHTRLSQVEHIIEGGIQYLKQNKYNSIKSCLPWTCYLSRTTPLTSG